MVGCVDSMVGYADSQVVVQVLDGLCSFSTGSTVGCAAFWMAVHVLYRSQPGCGWFLMVQTVWINRKEVCCRTVNRCSNSMEGFQDLATCLQCWLPFKSFKCLYWWLTLETKWGWRSGSIAAAGEVRGGVF